MNSSVRRLSEEEKEELIGALIALDGCIIKAMRSNYSRDAYSNELMVSLKKSLKTVNHLELLTSEVTLQKLLDFTGLGEKKYIEKFISQYKGDYLTDSQFEEHVTSSLVQMPLIYLMNYGEVLDLSPKFVDGFYQELQNYGINFNQVSPNKVEYIGEPFVLTNTSLLDATISGYMDLIKVLKRFGASFETVVEIDCTNMASHEIKENEAVKKVMVIEAGLLFFKNNPSYINSEMHNFLSKELEEININKERNRLSQGIALLESEKALNKTKNVKI